MSTDAAGKNKTKTARFYGMKEVSDIWTKRQYQQ